VPLEASVSGSESEGEGSRVKAAARKPAALPRSRKGGVRPTEQQHKKSKLHLLEQPEEQEQEQDSLARPSARVAPAPPPPAAASFYDHQVRWQAAAEVPAAAAPLHLPYGQPPPQQQQHYPPQGYHAAAAAPQQPPGPQAYGQPYPPPYGTAPSYWGPPGAQQPPGHPGWGATLSGGR